MTLSSDRFRRARREEPQSEEPGYIRTVPYDGGKYIDPEKFLEDEDIQEQLDWFEERDTVDGSQQERSGS
jgi:hypothetical protein